MNLVEFFGTVIKPKKVKGKKMMHPIETGVLNKKISVIRDKDVNAFFVKSDNGYIAIDSGYKNSENMKKGMVNLGIDGGVVACLLTHLDLDHAGGLDSRCECIYPNAAVYLGREESKYLTREYARKKILGLKLASPIQLHGGYTLIDDMQEFEVDGVKVTAILSPGHTLGHISYLIDDFLFVGDTLILNNEIGYCFWDFWNTNSDMNKQSLEKLYNIAKEKNVKLILTSHNGISNEVEKAFLHRNKYIEWNKKGFIFDDGAPFDAYE